MNQKNTVLNNTFYILSEKGLKIATYLTSGVIVARFSGPDIFGLYSSFLVISVIFSVVAAIGLNSLLVKEFFNARSTKKVMVNAFAIRLQAAIIAAVMLLLFSIWLIGENFNASIISALIVLIATFQIADCFFESQQQMWTVLTYKAPGYIIGMIIKISVAIYAPDAALLLVAHLIEMSLIFVGASVAMLHANGAPHLRDLDLRYQKQLFLRGMPLLFSSIAVIFYMKIDVIMVMRISGTEASGIYAAATRLSEALFILSSPVIIAAFPRLIALYNKDIFKYNSYMRRLSLILVSLGLFIAAATFIMSGFIIELLYGTDFRESTDVLRIYALSTPLLFFGDLFSRWILLSDNLALSWQRHLVGLLTNIALNFLLIPPLGPVGAAIASIAAYTSAIIIFSVMHPRARTFYSFLRTS